MKKMFVMAVAILFSAATMAQTTKQPKKKMSKDSMMMKNSSDTSMYKQHSKPMKKKMKSTKPMKDSLSTME